MFNSLFNSINKKKENFRIRSREYNYELLSAAASYSYRTATLLILPKQLSYKHLNTSSISARICLEKFPYESASVILLDKLIGSFVVLAVHSLNRQSLTLLFVSLVSILGGKTWLTLFFITSAGFLFRIITYSSTQCWYVLHHFPPYE